MPKPKTPPARNDETILPAATIPSDEAPPGDAPAEAPPAAPRPVPGTITAVAVLLFVLAILTGLFGAIMLFAGAIGPATWMWGPIMGTPPFDQPGSEVVARMAQFFVIAVSVIFLAAATAHVIAGVGILRLRSWARVLGLVLAVFGLLVFLLSVLGSVITFAQPWPSGFDPFADRAIFAARLGGTIFWLALSAIFGGFYAFVLVVLGRRGDVFA